MSERVLLKMNIGSPRLTPGIHASQSDELTRFDIAASLGMGNLSKGAQWFALAFYTHDREAEHDLKIHLYMLLMEKGRELGWKIKPGLINGESRSQILCNISMEEMFTPRYCKKCCGLGYVKTERDTCSSCSGSGRKSITCREGARRLQVDPMVWHRIWRQRMDHANQNLADIADELVRHVEKVGAWL